MCCVVGTWVERFTSVAQIGELQQPRPGIAGAFARRTQGNSQLSRGPVSRITVVFNFGLCLAACMSYHFKIHGV